MPQRSNPFVRTIHIADVGKGGKVRLSHCRVERGGPDEVFIPLGDGTGRRVRRSWCGDGTLVAGLGWVGTTPREALHSMRAYHREFRDTSLKDLSAARSRLKIIQEALGRL